MNDVIHIISDHDIGGAGRYLLTLVGSCDRTAWRIKVICPPDGQLAAELRRLGVAIIPLPDSDRSFSVQSLRHLVSVLRRERPDIVHTHASLSGRIAARLAGVPVVIMTRHTIGSEAVPGGARRFANRLIATRFTDTIIAVSDATARVLVAQGVPRGMIRVIRNGTDIRPTVPTVDPAALRAELGLAGGPLIGVIARLSPEKGHEVLLKAWPAVLAQHPDAQCLLVGAGVAEERLRAEVERLGLTGKVIFAGYRADVGAITSLLTALVLPSHSEALGLVLLEAMARGMPVVATRVGGVPEVVTSGRDGLLVPPADPSTMAEAINSLLGDPALARALGEAGRHTVSERFDAARNTAAVTELYAELLARKRAH